MYEPVPSPVGASLGGKKLLILGDPSNTVILPLLFSDTLIFVVPPNSPGNTVATYSCSIISCVPLKSTLYPSPPNPKPTLL